MGEMWLHIDINSYFATLLQQEIPQLRGRPVGVVKDVGRTCIIAASKEAKKFGVKTGSRVPDAKRLCPDLILVPANFDHFLSATKQLKKVFELYSPDVELFSLDEAFIHYTPLQRLYSSPQELGQLLQQKISASLGSWVTSNVGIGPNRFLAKMSGETSPKGSVSEINEDNLQAVLANVEFKDVCGIGSRLEHRLNRLGVTVPLQINFYDDEFLLMMFGPYWSVQLRKMGRGEEPDLLTRINATPHMKSVGRSVTGYKLCDDEAVIRQVLYNLTTEVIYKVRRMNLAGRQVVVSLEGQNGQRWRNFVTLKKYVRHTSEMFEIVYSQLYKAWQRSFPIIRFAVRLNLLKKWDEAPKEWFPAWWQQEKIASAIDLVTEKYGLFTIKPALFAKIADNKLLRPEATGYLGDQKFQLIDD